uniref:Uncharacterized protein n=1 Tax=Acanthochromis polyacanthus TaxID=80966 RepID=A0A3Q1GP51_9TELE
YSNEFIVHLVPEYSDEIVCLYCGVSYLIYHEFHQLRTHVAQLEAELQEMREMAQREKAQREALELERLVWTDSNRLSAFLACFLFSTYLCILLRSDLLNFLFR